MALNHFKKFGFGIRAIADEAKEYEGKYFRDFTLKERSSRRMFDGCFKTGVPDISLRKWKFYTRRNIMRDFYDAGFCDVQKSIIYIKKALAEVEERRKLILIHEMIHAYEWCLGKIIFDNGIIRQWLIISLYHKLINMDSRERIDQLIDIASDSRFWMDGHDLLFTLKSFELDFQLGLPFGTVFNDRGELIEYLLTLPLRRRKRVMEKYWNYSWDCFP